MAGEIEEPISLEESSLQAGSVSFGRFESEILSWERKSTFSQNRYLEEVEKYSTPGTVTQKKAYFEAHFKKKKDVLCQDSECQSRMEGQTNEDDNPDDMNYMKEIDQDNEVNHFTHCYENTVSSDDHGRPEAMDTQNSTYFKAHLNMEKDVLCQDSDCQNSMEGQENENYDLDDTNYMQEIAHDNEEIQFTHDYENTTSSNDHGSPEAMDIKEECNECSSNDSQIDPFPVSTVSVEDGDRQQVEPVELHKTHSEWDTQQLVNTEPEVDEKKKSVDEAESVDGLLDGANHLPKSQTTANDCVAGTNKLQKPKPKPKVSAQVVKKRTSSTSKDSEKDTVKPEKGSMKTRKEKQLPQKVILSASSRIKTVKTEDPKSKNAKPVQGNRSEKDEKAKKAGDIAQPLDFDESELKSQHAACRAKRSAKSSSAKPEVRPSDVAFSLRSNERAEKRKEFYIKLEEKLHTKEAEINQIQAKTQEEKEAQFKQFRRSLNFKATPMPSFYSGAVSRSSETKKSTSPGSNTRLSSFPTSKNQPSLPVNESASTNVGSHSPSTPLPTEAANSSTKPSTTSKKQTGKRLDAAGKEDKEKCKDASIQKHHGSQSSRVRKGGITNVTRERGSKAGSEMTKVVKGISIGEGSGVNHLSVNDAHLNEPIAT